MKSSGSYGEKLGYKLPHVVTNTQSSEKASPTIEKDVYVKQEEQFDNV